MKLDAECILWKKYIDKKGYGGMRFQGKTRLAHRVAYCLHHAIDIDDIDGICVRHKCDTPACVNPLHLELGTHQENMKDMVDRDRSTRGEKSAHAKLTKDQVEEIRRRYVPRSKHANMFVLADAYGICQAEVSQIVNHKRWK